MLTRLIIKNNTALSKKGTRSLILDFDDIMNIILGRNGYGKTTLLKELSQLPPDNADYDEGGYKEVHHKDDRGYFILKSHTGKNSTHEFILNGKNLNEGQTLTVQKDLVKNYFGVTQNVFNIISGLYTQFKFSTLTTNRRKEFLMSVNPNDTSYGLKIFERLKSNYNTTRGALKNQRQRLVVEEQRLKDLASMSVEELNLEISKFEGIIKEALILHGSLQHIKQHETRELREKIANITSRVIGVSSTITEPKDMLQHRLERCERRLESSFNLKTRYQAMLDEVLRQLDGNTNDNANLENYEKELNVIKTKLVQAEEDALEHAEFFGRHPLLGKYHDNKEFSYIIDDLLSGIQSVHKSNDEEISSRKYLTTKDLLKSQTEELNKINNTIKEINHLLEHYNKADNVVCPQCTTNFKVGFDRTEIEKKKQSLVLLHQKKESLENNITKLTDYVNDNEMWFETMGSLHRFIKRTNFTEDLLELIKEFKVGLTTQSVLVNMLENLKLYQAELSTIEYLGNEHDALENKVNFLKGAPVQEMFARAGHLRDTLGDLSAGIIKTQREIAKIKSDIETIDAYDLHVVQLDNLIHELKAKLEENGKYKIKLEVERAVNELTPRKDKLVADLIRAQSLNSVVDNIRENIEQLEKREKHLLLLMNGLSPVKGLIGKLMNDFLKSLIANMNAIIKPVWSDRLNVLNCSVEKKDDTTELNYSFPVVSGDSPKPNADVAFCSGGEREIIDFVFRVVILRYINKRAGLPLIMDEIGTPFDELHRARFCSFIDEQIRLDKLPQLFMVSHYWSEYTMFTDANIIALNTEGLNIPSKVNLRSKINC